MEKSGSVFSWKIPVQFFHGIFQFSFFMENSSSVFSWKIPVKIFHEKFQEKEAWVIFLKYF
jgi:hypothetical protein